MEFIQVKSAAKIQVKAYRPGEIQVNEDIYRHNLILLSDRIIEPWRLGSMADFTLDVCKELAALQPEILLIGTGEKLIFLSKVARDFFQAQKIGVECMSTDAACRTFQVLTSENRKVVAALIL